MDELNGMKLMIVYLIYIYRSMLTLTSKYLSLLHLVLGIWGLAVYDDTCDVNPLNPPEHKCALQLTINEQVGLGLVAGEDFLENTIVEEAIGVPVPMECIFHNPLINYADGYNDTHCLVLLGSASLYNH